MMKLFNTTVVVSSLGYFVDIYDLILFSMVRITSLKSLGFRGDDLMSKGTTLLNMQMGGMLIGGILWGMLGDKKGRVWVLYGSILLYSLANLANAFVGSFEAYACLRFLAGIGLAGELGAAVTLVSEVMPTHQRGYGVALVAGIGILGALFAAFISESFSWQSAYVVGGVMGLTLLFFRFKMQDSKLFEKLQETDIQRGNILMFLRNPQRLTRYLSCIFVGTPAWFIIGVLVAFAPEITSALQVQGEVRTTQALGYLYLGLSLGDLASGVLSQWIQSRKKVVFLFLLLCIPLIAFYLTQTGLEVYQYMILFFLLGITNGYWAVLITIAAEQFGTNLRATAATTVPNFIRAMVIPLSLGVQSIRTSMGLIPALVIMSCLAFGVAFFALFKLRESYDFDLNYMEHSA